MSDEFTNPGGDVYAQRGDMVRLLASTMDNIRDEESRTLMRLAMTRLIATIGPEAASIKTAPIPFVKPTPL